MNGFSYRSIGGVGSHGEVRPGARPSCGSPEVIPTGVGYEVGVSVGRGGSGVPTFPDEIEADQEEKVGNIGEGLERPTLLRQRASSPFPNLDESNWARVEVCSEGGYESGGSLDGLGHRDALADCGDRTVVPMAGTYLTDVRNGLASDEIHQLPSGWERGCREVEPRHELALPKGSCKVTTYRVVSGRDAVGNELSNLESVCSRLAKRVKTQGHARVHGRVGECKRRVRFRHEVQGPSTHLSFPDDMGVFKPFSGRISVVNGSMAFLGGGLGNEGVGGRNSESVGGGGGEKDGAR